VPKYDEVAVGDRIPEVTEVIDQARLIQYAGASGDFNPLHWQQEFAAQVSPTGGIIAHGMLNMGLVSKAVTEWAGGPENVRSLATTFRAPCPVGAKVILGGEVLQLDAEKRTATLSVWAELEDGGKVVDRDRSRAVVALD